ncbi:hypothetical protein ACEPAH_5278 [Sanghuangporus vaninii]
METLETLLNVSKLNDYVIRVLGQNPGKFTLQGTNTYLIGRHPPFVLVDTGEGRDEFLPLLEATLRQRRTQSYSDCLVSDIIITHRHRDHFGGLPSVLELLKRIHMEGNADADPVRPRIHKYPSPPKSESLSHESDLQSILSSLPTSTYIPSPSGSPIHDLWESQKLVTSDGTVSLTVLHTPGHTPDSICLLLRDLTDVDEQPNSLFTADSVLGQGTAVFEDLSTYLESLQRLLSLHEERNVKTSFKAVYPGHGPVVADGPHLISTYIRHRREREDQIVGVLSRPVVTQKGELVGEAGDTWTIWAIVGEIYKEYPENLWLPAAHGVGLHLRKLERDGRTRCLGGEGINQRWTLLPKV